MKPQTISSQVIYEETRTLKIFRPLVCTILVRGILDLFHSTLETTSNSASELRSVYENEILTHGHVPCRHVLHSGPTICLLHYLPVTPLIPHSFIPPAWYPWVLDILGPSRSFKIILLSTNLKDIPSEIQHYCSLLPFREGVGVAVYASALVLIIYQPPYFPLLVSKIYDC